MVKITGNLHINTGFIRIKSNINFVGAVQGMVMYDLSNLTEIELNPTPIEGVYLVDYAPDSNAPFLPSEHWIVPSKDCTFDEVRGIKNPDDVVVKLQEQTAQLKAEIAELSKQIIQLSLENAQLTLDNVEYQKQVTKVEETLKSTNQETNIEAETTKINTSLNILSRFKDPTVNEVKRIKNPDPYVVQLEEQIAELKTENSELILQKHNYLNQIEWLNVQLNNTKQQNELATKSLGEMLSKARSENLEITSQKEDYLNQVESLITQLEDTKKQNEVDIQSLKEMLSQAKSENLELTLQNEEYLSQIHLLEQTREQTITPNNKVAALEETETTKINTSLNILSRFK